MLTFLIGNAMLNGLRCVVPPNGVKQLAAHETEFTHNDNQDV